MVIKDLENISEEEMHRLLDAQDAASSSYLNTTRTMDDILKSTGCDLKTTMTKAAINYSYFLEHIVGWPLSEHHFEWARQSQTHKLLCLEAPRGHWKSNIFSVGLPMWIALFHQNQEILIVSYTQPQASEFLMRQRQIMDRNELLGSLRPPKREQDKTWSKSEMRLATGTRIIAKGIMQSTRGTHKNLIVCDDIMKDKYSKVDDIKMLFWNAIWPMRDYYDAPFFVVGTPQHWDDILVDLSTRPGWSFRKYPALINEEEKKVLWSKQYPFEKLMMIRDQNPTMFQLEYMLNPMQPGTALIPWKTLQYALDPQMKWEFEPKPEASYVIGVDTARSGTASADFSVFTVLKYSPTGAMRVANIWRRKGLSIPQQVSVLASMSEDYFNATAIVEENYVGVAFTDSLSQMGVPWRGFTTTMRTKGDLIMHLTNLIIKRDDSGHSKLSIPYHPDIKDEAQVLVDELLSFGTKKLASGRERLESLAGHDDCVMSLALACWFYRGYMARSEIGLDIGLGSRCYDVPF